MSIEEPLFAENQKYLLLYSGSHSSPTFQAKPKKSLTKKTSSKTLPIVSATLSTRTCSSATKAHSRSIKWSKRAPKSIKSTSQSLSATAVTISVLVSNRTIISRALARLTSPHKSSSSAVPKAITTQERTTACSTAITIKASPQLKQKTLILS